MFLLCHPWVTTTSFSYRFATVKISATALCCTTGIICVLFLLKRKCLPVGACVWAVFNFFLDCHCPSTWKKTRQLCEKERLFFYNMHEIPLPTTWVDDVSLRSILDWPLTLFVRFLCAECSMRSLRETVFLPKPIARDRKHVFPCPIRPLMYFSGSSFSLKVGGRCSKYFAS